MNVSERPSGAFEATLFSSSRGDLRNGLSPKRKPMVGDPVKLHLATWMISVTTSILAMWSASFALIKSQKDVANTKIQQEFDSRIDTLESEFNQLGMMSKEILRQITEHREAEHAQSKSSDR